MRSSVAVFLQRPFCRALNLVALVLAIGCSNAPAQQQISSPDTLALLARAGYESESLLDGNVDLETGYLAMLGMGEKA